MGLLAQQTAFEAKDIETTAKDIAVYTATKDILLQVGVLAGRDTNDDATGLLAATASVLTVGFVVDVLGSGVDSTESTPAAVTKDQATSENQYIDAGQIFLSNTDVLTVNLLSSDANGDVDGLVFFLDKQSGYDAALIGSATPEKFTDAPSGGQGSRDKKFAQHGRY